MAIPQLEVLDDDRLGELDKDIAEQYFEHHGFDKPNFMSEADK